MNTALAIVNTTIPTKLEGIQDLTTVLQPGMFLEKSLFSDTVVMEVVKVTPKTVTLRNTARGEQNFVDESCDNNNLYSAMWQEQVADPEGKTFTVRLSKAGTLKAGNYARAGVYRTARLINGTPVARVDYRY